MSDTLTASLARAALLPHHGLRFLDRSEAATWLAWGEIETRAREVAGSLGALGIERGERVALVYPTSPEFVVAFFGVVLAGAVPAPLYPPLRLGRLAEYHAQTARQLTAASARLVLADPRVRRILGEAMAMAAPRHGCLTLEELAATRGARPPLVPVGPDDLALVQFSSGTTVAPKPVALTHRAVMAQARLLNGYWPHTAEVTHSGVTWLPLYHDMGLIGHIFPALDLPAELTLLGPEHFVARPALWLRAISRYRATVSAAPNFAYGLCVSRVSDEDMEGCDLSSWRVALDGAETVSPETARAFNARFARWGLRPEALSPVYGLSEAALAVTFSDFTRPFLSRRFARAGLCAGRALPDEDGVEMVSVGRPLPGFELALRDSLVTETTPVTPDHDLPEGEVGRLWVKGPSLMAGYLDQPEATAEALRDGWLDTGDLGFRFEGELYLTGRAKDVLILRGQNHGPEEVEQAIEGLPGVRTGCAVASSWMPEAGEREVLGLFVERARAASPAEIAALPAACNRAVLATTGLQVDEVHVLAPGTLPRTSSGKLRRAETLRLYRAGELRPPAPVSPLLLAGAMLRSRRALRRMRREAARAKS